MRSDDVPDAEEDKTDAEENEFEKAECGPLLLRGVVSNERRPDRSAFNGTAIAAAEPEACAVCSCSTVTSGFDTDNELDSSSSSP